MQNDGFNISFSFNGNYLGSMFVKGDMMMADVVTNLIKNFPWINQCQPTFYINSNEIKATSCKTMKDLGMKNMSYIEIKTMNNQAQAQPGMGMMQPGMGPSVNMPGNKPQNIPGNIGGEDYLNIIFNVEGKVVNVQATKNNKFSELSAKFLVKADAKNKVPSFLLNGSMMESNVNQTLEQLHIQNNQRIEVVFTQNVIGAYY